MSGLTNSVRERPAVSAVEDFRAPASLHAVILAAGGSTRFGSPKQLATLRGQTLLRSIVEGAREVVGEQVTVVLGAFSDALAPLIADTGSAVVMNPQWREGMAGSVCAGVAGLPGDCAAVLLLLVDQPAVTTADLRRLIGQWRAQPDSLVAAEFSGTTGAPAIFPRRWFPDLLALRGDRGAQSILRRHGEGLVRVPMGNAALDVDTPADLARLDGPGAPG